MGRTGLTPLPLWPVITGLGVTQIIGWGTTYYALGALSADIAAREGWSKTLIFGAFSAALLLSGLISPWAGRLIDRRGGKKVMAAGSLLMAAGCLIIGIAPHPLTYAVGWLVLGVAMRLALYDAAFASLAQIAGDRTRRAVSYLALFGGFASTTFWPAGHLLSERIGWSNAFLVYAALHVLICLPLHWLLLGQSQGETSAPPPEAVQAANPLDGTERRKAMILFAAVLALNGLVFSSVSAHVLPLFEGLGFSSAEAVTFAALIGPSQVASRIGEIFLGRRLKSVHLGIIAFGLLPVALSVFALGGFGATAALVFALLYGASNGLVTIAKGAVPLALFGRKGFGEVLGILAAPNLVLNATAPLLFAMLLGVAGAAQALMIAGAAALISALAMLWLARIHPR